jgi:succinate--hydroxymethylglutarate CoA-transferase
MGTSHPSIVPYEVLPTKDSFVMLGAGNEGQFSKLCNKVGLSHLVEDPKFKTNTDRVKHRKELISKLESRLKEENSEYWLKKLQDAGFPYAPISNIQETFNHPQIVARGLVHEIDHPRAGKIKVVGPPIKYSDAEPSVRLPPPLLGQHTDEVLGEVLGYSPEAIQNLRNEGAIGAQMLDTKLN